MGISIDKEEKSETRRLPLLPLKDIVVFPHMIVPVFINEDLCISAVEKSLSEDRQIFLSAFKVVGADGDGLECSQEPPFDVYNVGTLCSIMRTRKLPDGRMKVLVQGVKKAKIKKIDARGAFPLVDIETVVEHEKSEQSQAEAMIRVVRESLEKVVSLGKILSPDILMILEDVHEPGRLADLVAANLGLKVEEAQQILAVSESNDRLKKVHAHLSREIEVFQMQIRIQSQAKEEIGKMQREHYLREQIRALKSELGDSDPKDEIDDLWRKMEAVHLSEEAKEEVSRQIKRLERMHQDTSEASLTRNHIETILTLPWEKYSEDSLEIKNVVSVLDEDHYGLDQVKDRIIEYLAVKKLNPKAKSPILCFVGPPGVGKTSLGRSIGKAMGREFYRIALGGVRDEADIRGHRKTYVGAFPGRILSSLKKVQSANPVIMLDEIDKLGSDHKGDPSAALLEVLDPEQNHTFVDHYLGIAFDLSKIMFIANANSLDSIPAPLKDRLEIIHVSGYSEDEKLEIARRYLIPKQVEEAGLSSDIIQLSSSSVQSLIRGYTRESGLRGLEKKIASVCRKIARNVAELEEAKDSKKYKITPQVVKRLLGANSFGSEFYHADAAVGVSLGMAYTQYGGEILAVETNILPGKERLVLTGQLGDVMRESAQAALSYIRSSYSELWLASADLENMELHVHVPQGAVPKDGPSAGVTLVTSMLSALLKTAPKAKVCMTGEITLHGKVLPIGGLKEKLLAAQREGMEKVLLPHGNRVNYDALPHNLKKKIKVEFFDHYSSIFAEMFPSHKVSLKALKDPDSNHLAS